MAIERALVGFSGAVAAATAAARAGTPVPPHIAADPAAFFQHLVELRGETEMKRHAERLAVHVLGECRAGRLTLAQADERVTMLTGIAIAFPPKPTALAEALDRPAGRSAAAAALILASAIVSRAQARGRPEQTRVDPSWATDMIAEALTGIVAEPEFLAAIERGLVTAVPGAMPTPRTSAPVFSAAQLREACVKHGVEADEMTAIVASKTAQVRDLAKSLSSLAAGMGEDPAPQRILNRAVAALGEGDLTVAHDELVFLAKRLKDAGLPAPSANVLAGLGQLEDIRMEPRASAQRFGEAFDLLPRSDAAKRWNFALRQAGALASEADELAAAGQPNNRPLAEAVRIYASALGLLPASEALDLRSVTHNSLGNTLLRMGEIERKADLFAHAANSYRAAASFMSQDKAGREWALVQSNLGTALLKGGEIAQPERNYEEAAAAFERALTMLKPETDGADWAAAEAGRGMADGRLGALRNDLSLLERTARSVDAALARFDRKVAPAQWARLQSCLGNICADLGERIGGKHWLERAIAAYEAAQEEWTEERSPLQWALSEANRGGAHLGLGTLTASRRHLHLADDSLAHASAVFRQIGQTAYAEAAEQSLATVRTELGRAGLPPPPPAPQSPQPQNRARV